MFIIRYDFQARDSSMVECIGSHDPRPQTMLRTRHFKPLQSFTALLCARQVCANRRVVDLQMYVRWTLSPRSFQGRSPQEADRQCIRSSNRSCGTRVSLITCVTLRLMYSDVEIRHSTQNCLSCARARGLCSNRHGGQKLPDQEAFARAMRKCGMHVQKRDGFYSPNTC